MHLIFVEEMRLLLRVICPQGVHRISSTLLKREKDDGRVFIADGPVDNGQLFALSMQLVRSFVALERANRIDDDKSQQESFWLTVMSLLPITPPTSNSSRHAAEFDDLITNRWGKTTVYMSVGRDAVLVVFTRSPLIKRWAHRSYSLGGSTWIIFISWLIPTLVVELMLSYGTDIRLGMKLNSSTWKWSDSSSSFSSTISCHHFTSIKRERERERQRVICCSSTWIHKVKVRERAGISQSLHLLFVHPHLSNEKLSSWQRSFIFFLSCSCPSASNSLHINARRS